VYLQKEQSRAYSVGFATRGKNNGQMLVHCSQLNNEQAFGSICRNEAIEALIRVHGVLGLPHEVPLEFERLREIDRIRRRQRVVETAVVRVRDEALDGSDLVALRRPK
jgi:hypothetical protein